MKKLVFALFVAALLVGVAGSAFAAGHVTDPVIEKPAVVPTDIVPPTGAPAGVVVSGDITVFDKAGFEGAKTPDGKNVFGEIKLVAQTGATYEVLASFSLQFKGTTAEKAQVKSFNIAKVIAKMTKKPNVVFLYKHTSPVGMKEFAIAADGTVNLGEYNLADFFTANVLTVATKAVPSSSSGCSTGSVAPAFLLLLAPLAILLKK